MKLSSPEILQCSSMHNTDGMHCLKVPSIEYVIFWRSPQILGYSSGWEGISNMRGNRKRKNQLSIISKSLLSFWVVRSVSTECVNEFKLLHNSPGLPREFGNNFTISIIFESDSLIEVGDEYRTTVPSQALWCRSDSYPSINFLLPSIGFEECSTDMCRRASNKKN
jgi:hypothetical protein